MGRMLGSFGAEDELDRPDLNKCPDCGCFFAQDCCPLCGKPCPEEMRAGNRKPVKIKRNRRRGGSGRVTFIEWYHSWWFIILMLFVFPLLGIILLFTSPHKKWIKATVIGVAVVYTVASTIGLGTIFRRLTNIWDRPVDTRLSRDEYIEKCETVTPESLYRTPDTYKGEYVSTTLTVAEKVIDSDGYYSNEHYTTYYICTDSSGTFEIMIRDCLQDGAQNFAIGDIIVIWGEGAGNCGIYDMNYNLRSHPCINVAYAESLPME